MTYLLYGIVFSGCREPVPGQEPRVLPRGIGGEPVQLIEVGELGAAVSAIEASHLTPSITDVLTYAKVVGALHAQRTIVPMRYGCACAGEDEVVELLRTRGQHYAEILRRVEGCVEMAVRINLLPSAPLEHTPSQLVAHPQSAATAYLTERARIYAARDQRVREAASVTEWIRAACTGQFVRFKVDGADGGQPVVSANFLVKRQALESFRAACLNFSRTQPTALRISGPWPPYNFVVPERCGCARDATARRRYGAGAPGRRGTAGRAPLGQRGGERQRHCSFRHRRRAHLDLEHRR